MRFQIFIFDVRNDEHSKIILETVKKNSLKLISFLKNFSTIENSVRRFLLKKNPRSQHSKIANDPRAVKFPLGGSFDF